MLADTVKSPNSTPVLSIVHPASADCSVWHSHGISADEQSSLKCWSRLASRSQDSFVMRLGASNFKLP